MAKSSKKGILIDDKPTFRILNVLGGAADLKYAFAEAARRKYSSLKEAMVLYAIDCGFEGWSDDFGVFDITQFGANGKMGEALTRWRNQKLLSRLPKDVVTEALQAALEDPTRELAHGAGAKPAIAACAYEVAQMHLWGYLARMYAEILGEMGWPHALLYQVWGVAGGFGEGLSKQFDLDCRDAMNKILSNRGVKQIRDVQKAITVVPLAFSWRSYSSQVFTENGELTDRADEIQARCDRAAEEHKQVIFVNGEVSHIAMDMILRKSPGMMRRVVNAKEDGNKPFGLITVRAQTHRQLLRLAAYALTKTTMKLQKPPFSYTSEVVPATIGDALSKLAGNTDYEKKREYVLTLRLSVLPAGINVDMPVAVLAKVAHEYRVAQNAFDAFVRQSGDPKILQDKKVLEVRTKITDGNERINRLLAKIRELAGQTGLYVWDWEKPTFEAVLALKVSEAIAGVNKVLAQIPDFDDVMHLSGKGGKPSIREIFVSDDGAAALLFEMGSQWVEKPSFVDPGAERDAEELSKLVKEFFASQQKKAADENVESEVTNE